MTDMDFSAITACGECCTGCEKKSSGFCAGCMESDGNCREWLQSGGCPIYKCAKQHGVQFCGLCSEFPCEWLPRKAVWNPDIIDDLKKLAVIYKNKLNTL